MKGTDLEAWCKEMGGERGCSECPCKKQCDRWKEEKKKLLNMEPWELGDIQKIFKHLIDGYDYKYGREL